MHPDITHVVHILSQFVVAPTTTHHQVSLWTLRYLKQRTRNFFLVANYDV